ncbi:MAG: hypothetical protein ABIW82_11075 [Dokdonella sp.]
MNETLQRGGGIQNLSIDAATDLLNRLGDAAGAQTQVLIAHINELQAAADRTLQAAQRIKDETASIQDQIDQINGNEAGIEDRRHAKKLADLQAEADANGTASTFEYRHLTDLENQLHDLKLKNLQSEGKGGGSGGGGVGGLSNGGGGVGAPPRPGGNAPAPQPGPAPTSSTPAPSIHTTINAVLLTGDQKSADALADLLTRRVNKNISDIQSRSR